MIDALQLNGLMRRRWWNPGRFMVVAGLVACCALALAQTSPTDDVPAQTDASTQNGEQPDPPATESTARPDAAASPAESEAAAEAASTPELAPPAPGSPQARYGLWVALPAVVAILLAILFRQVVPALVVGIFTGAYMIIPCLAAGDPYAGMSSWLGGFRVATERYIFGALTYEPEKAYTHLKIIMFTLVIGFTVGVIGRNGGTEGMVRLVAGKTSSPRRGGLTAWLAGMIVFFDDYANTMIIGPTMQPVFDKLKLSRAKLAYIVDSTAAPVASIAIIGTWIGAEIGYINQGIDVVAKGAVPAFMMDDAGNTVGGMQAFLNSIPYRFYPLLALWFVFLIALTGRDFGPMKRSERKTLSRIEPDPTPADLEKAATRSAKPRWWLGLIPVLALVVVTVGVLIISGYRAEGTAALMNAVTADGASEWTAKSWWERAGDVISNGDAYLSIFHGAMLAALLAVLLTIIARACRLRDAVDSGLDGMSRMFPAIVILVLAWALSQVLQDLKLGEVVAGHLDKMQFPARWLPFATFTSAALISFATGTSWGTMGILCPFTVEIAARLISGADIETAEATTLFYAAVGAVLSGAVFGDHCSPISDTTVLSSIASGCPHEEHVWTQMPYALLTAFAAMGLGDVLSSAYNFPWYLGLLAGAVFLFVVIFLIGRKPVPTFELADA